MIEYQTRIRTLPDIKETVRISQMAWLSGIFETGGSMGFSIETWPNRQGYESTYPYISINTSPKKVKVLESLFGGRHQPQKENSWKWELKGPKAIGVSSLMEPLSPSRKTVIGVFRALEKETFMNQKVEIAKKWKQTGIRKDDVTADDYLKLLQIPAFTAGIFDAIGNIRSTPSAPLRTQIDSTNEPLIKALTQKFGGSVSTRVKPGTPVSLPEARWITKNHSFELILGIRNSLELLQLITPHVRMMKKEVRQALEQTT